MEHKELNDYLLKVMKIIRSNFLSDGLKCAGRLYLPEGITKPPVVLMAHGFGAEKEFGLPPFAERFAMNGFAVFLFDYRNFGESEGEPRNWISPARHLKDWCAALNHVRKLEVVNSERIALWGTSFSGGHVLVTAAREKGIKAVIAQVPFVDGIATARFLGVKFVITALYHGLKDLFRLITFREPHTIPIVGPPEEFAALNTPECMPGYLRLVPEEHRWKNRCPARIMLTTPSYRPIRYVSRIQCPVLIVLAEKDSLIPPAAVIKTAERIKNPTVLKLSVGHFDVYFNNTFERVVTAEIEFLKKNL